MKKNYWYFLAIFVAFISMLTLMPHRAVAQTNNPTTNDQDAFDKTNNEEANGFRSDEDTFDNGDAGTQDGDDRGAIEEGSGGGKHGGDDDNGDDDNYNPPS